MIYNDYELVNMIRDGNEDAKNILYNKYLPIIKKKTLNIYKYVQDKGLDLDDIKQECLLAFEESIDKYNQDGNSIFYTFTNLVMDRSLATLVRDASGNKYKYLNEAIPIETLDDNTDMINYIRDDNINPMRLCIYNDDYINLYKRIIDKLTDFEECVFVLKIKGFDNKDIAVLLDRDEKSIINAMHRVKLKVRDLNV